MPRYFFNLADGSREQDTDGVELPDIAAARLMAVEHAGELLGSEPTKLWQHGQWRVEVTDERGILLCTVITLAIDAPTPEQQAGR